MKTSSHFSSTLCIAVVAAALLLGTVSCTHDQNKGPEKVITNDAWSKLGSGRTYVPSQDEAPHEEEHPEKKDTAHTEHKSDNVHTGDDNKYVPRAKAGEADKKPTVKENQKPGTPPAATPNMKNKVKDTETKQNKVPAPGQPK